MKYNCNIKKEQEDMYVVEFPDMTNVTTYGFTPDHAVKMAKEALEGVLETALEKGHRIPVPKYRKGTEIEVNPKLAFAIELRQARGARTQQDIADAVGMTYQQYQRLEDPKKTNPTINTIFKLEHALGKSFLAF